MLGISKIDINCDMAELESVDDTMFMPYISSVNVCCGEHSGNPEKINATIRAALNHKLKIGAHPSYPDRENFGRVSMNIDNEELVATLMEQVLYIKLLVEAEGKSLHHVKAHGALYNDLVSNDDVLYAFLDAIRYVDPSLTIYALAHNKLIHKIRNAGFKVKAEGFMDRAYNDDMTLVRRTIDGSVYSNIEQVISQLDLICQGRIKSTNGKLIEGLKCETVCLHSDTPNAAFWIQRIGQHLEKHGIKLG